MRIKHLSSSDIIAILLVRLCLSGAHFSENIAKKLHIQVSKSAHNPDLITLKVAHTLSDF